MTDGRLRFRLAFVTYGTFGNVDDEVVTSRTKSQHVDFDSSSNMATAEVDVA
jgi:hypothetical protein